MHLIPVQSTTDGFSFASHTCPGNLSYNSYVVPWSQHQSKSEFQPQPQQQTHQSSSPPSSRHTHYESVQQHHQPAQQEQLQQRQHHQYSPHQQHLQLHKEPQPLQYQPQHQTLQSKPQPQACSHSHPQLQLQYQAQTVHGHQPQPQQQFQNQHLQYPSRYPPPPWSATPGYANYQNHSPATNVISTQANTRLSYPSAPGVRPELHNSSFPAKVGIGGSPANATGQKHFVPSYRLFEDLNVFGNTDGKVKMTSSCSSSSLSGTMGPGIVGGRK